MKPYTMNEFPLSSARNSLLFLALVIIPGILVNVVDRPTTHFVATLEQTYTITRGITLILSIAIFCELYAGLKAALNNPFQLAWRSTLRRVWIPALISSGIIALLALLTHNEVTPTNTTLPWEQASRVIEISIPLAIGILAAMCFSPSDEPALEIQLAAPRPIAWVLIERLSSIWLTHGMIALVGAVIISLRFPELDAGIALIRWIPTAVFFSGVGVFTTIRSGQMVFGVVMTGVVWFITMFFTPLFLPGLMIFYPLNYIQPYLWVINPYLQPDIFPLQDYWLNRLCVLAFGVFLLALSIRNLTDEEQLLTGTK